MFNVAYADKNKIQNGIAQGVIPNESLIITNNDVNAAELSYYDEKGNLKSIVRKTQFESENEALLWINKYNYAGVNVSIFDAKANQWNSFIVGADNKMNKIVNDDNVADSVTEALDGLFIDGGTATIT